MSRSSLQVFDQFRYGHRSVLIPGNQFSVTGGFHQKPYRVIAKVHSANATPRNW